MKGAKVGLLFFWGIVIMDNVLTFNFGVNSNLRVKLCCVSIWISSSCIFS